ncbi:MAG: hypothetical protein JNL43_00700 [Flavobacteriales bacterium]|nr:hypothetical protein [Flavobacteriales bacterium]
MTDLEALIGDLDRAVKLASQFSGGYSDHHFSAEEFHANLLSKVDQLKSGDTSVLREVMLWFTPSYDWDDFTGEEGVPLGNEIFSKLIKLQQEGVLM